MRQYHLKNREKHLSNMRLYRETNFIKMSEKKKLWYESNRDKCKAKAKFNYEKDKKRHRILGLKYRLLNPKASKIHSQVRKANQRCVDKITTKILQSIFESNIKKHGTLTCYLCLFPIIFGDDSVDHKIPISRGGLNVEENIGITHKRCNSRKLNKNPEEYMAYIEELKSYGVTK